jgi:hypothetical protein
MCCICAQVLELLAPRESTTNMFVCLFVFCGFVGDRMLVQKSQLVKLVAVLEPCGL